jgi:hypothetical protein
VAPEVFPIQISGAIDTDLTSVSSSELLRNGLSNLSLDTREPPYAVRHGMRPVSDFPVREAESDSSPSPTVTSHRLFERAFPCLFPYGEGGLESPRAVPLSLQEHVRWCLLYHDRRFRTNETFPFVAFGILRKREALMSARLQMRRSTFQRDARILSSIDVRRLDQAQAEESRGQPISDPVIRLLYKNLYAAAGRVVGTDQRRYQLRSKIRSMSLALNPPSLWITINPCDLHDPIAQVFAGVDIDMDRFCATIGPNKESRAVNIANDPFASALFFRTIITLVLETLFGIQATGRKITRHKGVFGYVNGYVASVESQNRGSLHAHMLLWLVGAPTGDEMNRLLQTTEFKERVVRFIKQNLRAYLPGLESAESIKQLANEADIAYSRPPNPASDEYDMLLQNFERRVVRSKQIHTCHKSRCLIPVKKSSTDFRCKRGAPFDESEEDFVDEYGRWGSKRLFGRVNGWIPSISINARCNNDGKLLTNGEATKNISIYVSYYQTKKQGKTFNLSSIVARGLQTHAKRTEYADNLLERQRLLIFRLVHTINREQELAAPLVMSYLMGWDDNLLSHNYSAIYWSSFVAALLSSFPELRSMHDSRYSYRSVFFSFFLRPI